MAVTANLSAGQVLTASTVNNYMINSGLVYVTQATAAGTGTTLSVNNCFTSTAVNYLIRWNGYIGANDQNLSIRFRVGGADTQLGYRYTVQQQYVGIGAVGVSGSNSGTTLSLGSISSTETEYHIQIANPQLAKPTYIGSEGINNQTAYGNGIDAYRAQGFLQNTTQYDGFTLISASGNLTGTVYVYAYRNS